MPKNRSPLGTPSSDQTVWTPPRVGVCVAVPDEQLRSRARVLAAESNLPVVARDGDDCDLLLVVTGAGLELHEAGCGAAGGVKVDFSATGENARRLATASRRQPLALAVGLKKRTPTIVDATAGLGRDAMLLASLGCPVIAVERSVILGAMLRDALERVVTVPAAGEIRPCQMTLIIGDAVEVLARMSEQEAPDVVYLDPMYPPSGKSALPKKEMRILRRLVGDDPDAGGLLEVARRVARDRVVVKRTPRAPPLAPAPTMSYRGKLARYDVYITQK
ncbi:MAG: class I SAM-dependent methyltransferase [Planctomycetota bacterium]